MASPCSLADAATASDESSRTTDIRRRGGSLKNCNCHRHILSELFVVFQRRKHQLPFVALFIDKQAACLTIEKVAASRLVESAPQGRFSSLVISSAGNAGVPVVYTVPKITKARTHSLSHRDHWPWLCSVAGHQHAAGISGTLAPPIARGQLLSEHWNVHIAMGVSILLESALVQGYYWCLAFDFHGYRNRYEWLWNYAKSSDQTSL